MKKKTGTAKRTPPYYVTRRAGTAEELESVLNTLRDEGFAIHYILPSYVVVAWKSAL